MNETPFLSWDVTRLNTIYPDLLMMISPNVKLRAEFKPLLSLLSLSIEFSKKIKRNVRVIVEPHQITIQSNYNFVFELDGLTLLPESCRSLRWGSSTELQLTLQANQKDEGSDSNGMINHKASPTTQDFIVSRIQSSQNHCHCVGCGARIFKSHSHFKRVLPLPSENWSDFADIWFCHNHSHNASDTQQESVSCSGDGLISDHVKELKRFPMTPRVDDCLVSNLYMLVNSCHVKTGCVAQTAGRLMCKRCSNFIGFVKDESNNGVDQSGSVFKIYHHAVKFTSDESNDVHTDDVSLSQEPVIFSGEKQQHIEDFLYCLLRDQSHLFTSFRFILTSSLQAKEQSSISVLLWLLDQELSVFTAHLPSPHRPNETCVKMCSCKYLKLLYKATFTTLGECDNSYSLSKSSNVFGAWRLDNTVHGISLPYPLCKQLIHLLVTSTKTLTKSQRSLNGFHVGFLKVS